MGWLMLGIIAQLVVIVAAPPLLLGVIVRTKAVMAGRTGPPLLQPYFDIIKLLRKDAVISPTTSWLFLAGPAVSLLTAAIACALVPLGSGGALWSFEGDFIALAYVLGLGRFATIAAALDTGSSFEGMGAAREATFACLAEPAFVLGLLAIAHATGALSMSDFLGPSIHVLWSTAGASAALVTAGLFVVLLAENSRIPVDDPNTHLELTMVHEVMVLDHGGPLLGMALYAASLKLLVFAALLVKIAVPVHGSTTVGWLAFAGGMLVVAILIGLVESTMARLRLSHVPAFLLAACLLCGLAVVLLVR